MKHTAPKGRLHKIVINGHEICDFDYISPDLIQEGGVVPPVNPFKEMEPITGEITFKLSWWSNMKLRWFLFKTKYFNKENIYTIKFWRKDE